MFRCVSAKDFKENEWIGVKIYFISKVHLRAQICHFSVWRIFIRQPVSISRSVAFLAISDKRLSLSP